MSEKVEIKSDEKKTQSTWPEIRKAFETKRYELILAGPEISKRIEENNGELDSSLFKLKQLNFLEIAKTKLTALPMQISYIENLTSLLCHTNEITTIPPEIGKLTSLKNLDFSNNKLTSLPEELGNLKELMTINLGGNQLTALFPLEYLTKLAVLDISRNKFNTLLDKNGDLSKLENLSQINASFNEIAELTEKIADLPSIKTINLENNLLTQIPSNLCQCSKLKELLLKQNKLKDNRLKKLVEQDKLKPVLEYLERAYIEDSKSKQKSAQGNKSTTPSKSKSKNAASFVVEYDLIKVIHCNDVQTKSIDVHCSDTVTDVRPYILCAIIRNLDLKTPGNLKKFLNIQTKLHDETCMKRTLATIATHGMENLKDPLYYLATDPNEIELVPLGRVYPLTASDYYEKLMEEAEAERKAKKRNQLSGIYKYLTLLENKKKFAFFTDKNKEVISLPPLTNAEKTKMTVNTNDVFIEITSTESLDMCKKVMEELVIEMIKTGITSSGDLVEKVSALSVNSDKPNEESTANKTSETIDEESNGKLRHTILMQQVKIVDAKGNLKTVYPSRIDLNFAETDSKIRIARLYEDSN